MSEEALPTPEGILSVLPHRYPFLMIDKVIELDDEHVVAVKNVSFGEPYFQGHFPGQPVMPGVLQVEAMAQAAVFLARRAKLFDPDKQVVYFVSIDKVKFRQPVKPGDQLVIEVKPLRTGRICKFAGEAKVDGKVVSSGEFLATMAPKEA